MHARSLPVLAAAFCVLLTGSAFAVSYEVRVDAPQPSGSTIDVLDDSASFSAGDLTGGVGQDFGASGENEDQIGYIDPRTRAIFGRSYAAEPDVLIEQLRQDEAIAEADTLLLTVPNQLGVAYNAHVIEAILTHVAPALGWR